MSKELGRADVETQRVAMDHPLVQFFEDRLRDMVCYARELHGADSSSSAITLVALIGRQLAMIDLQTAGDVMQALTDELRSNYSDEAATARRIVATTDMFRLTQAAADQIRAEYASAMTEGRVS